MKSRRRVNSAVRPDCYSSLKQMWNPTKALSRTLQITFGTLSILLFFAYLLIFLNLPIPMPTARILIIAACPPLYWAFCAVTTFAIRPGRLLAVLGIVGHFALLPLIIWFLFHDATLAAVFFCGFGLMWYLVYMTRRAEQIVGRERRQRVSQDDWSGDA